MIYLIGEKNFDEILATLKTHNVHFSHFPLFSLELCDALAPAMLYFIDFDLKGTSPFKACRDVRKAGEKIIYLLSNNMDETNISYAKANGANDVIRKDPTVILKFASDFLSQNKTTPKEISQSAAFSSDNVKKIKDLATFYLGPIADFMFSEFQEKNLNNYQIMMRFSEQLSGRDRADFLNNANKYI